MQLQDGSGAGRLNGPEAHVVHGLGLLLTVGDDEHHVGVHDRLDAHGIGLTGHILDVVEQAAVRFDRALGKIDAVRALGEAGVGLIEADVAVVADTEELQIRVTGLLDNAVVL